MVGANYTDKLSHLKVLAMSSVIGMHITYLQYYEYFKCELKKR